MTRIEGEIVSKHGELNWVELQTCNVEGAMKLYGELYGWTFQAEENENGDVYWLISNDGNFPFGGILTVPEDSPEAPRWIHYFHIEDVDSAIQTILNNSGKVMKGPREVKGVGRVVWLQDANGAEFGLITPSSEAPG